MRFLKIISIGLVIQTVVYLVLYIGIPNQETFANFFNRPDYKIYENKKDQCYELTIMPSLNKVFKGSDFSIKYPDVFEFFPRNPVHESGTSKMQFALESGINSKFVKPIRISVNEVSELNPISLNLATQKKSITPCNLEGKVFFVEDIAYVNLPETVKDYKYIEILCSNAESLCNVFIPQMLETLKFD